MDELILPLDAFVRSVGINKSRPHLLFLGAGASVSSGVPSAERCIWEWKRSIFLTRNLGLEEQFSELSLVGVRQRIQRWLDQQGGFPAEGAPDEYSFYTETCFPISNDRLLISKKRYGKPSRTLDIACWAIWHRWAWCGPSGPRISMGCPPEPPQLSI
jgi:hypothetical protein